MRTTRATVDGQTYDIPDMWLAGAARTLGTTEAAVREWHEQAQLEQEIQALETTVGACLVKVARVREAGVPIGQPAKMFLNCPCGARPEVTDGFRVLCTSCNALYDSDGTVRRAGEREASVIEFPSAKPVAADCSCQVCVKVRGRAPEAPKAKQAAPSLVGMTLRSFSSAGPCITYKWGTIMKYTDKTVTYRAQDGKIKRAGGYQWHSNGTRPLGKGLLHAGPCHSCTDHKNTQYPHGYMD